MKKKLNINGLKVTSFVTDLSVNNVKTVKGGYPMTGQYCDSEVNGYCWSDNPNQCPTYVNNCTAVNCGSANPC